MISQNKLTAVWSNDDDSGGQNKFELCWNKFGETYQPCSILRSSETKISRPIPNLQSATKYLISVARYSKDEKTFGRKTQKFAITRSGQCLFIFFRRATIPTKSMCVMRYFVNNRGISTSSLSHSFLIL